MRINIELDDRLMSEAFALTGLKTRQELINFALQELVSNKKQPASNNLCDAFRKLHQFELSENPLPETKRENRPNSFPDW